MLFCSTRPLIELIFIHPNYKYHEKTLVVLLPITNQSHRRWRFEVVVP
jgi:hypothetical protein